MKTREEILREREEKALLAKHKEHFQEIKELVDEEFADRVVVRTVGYYLHEGHKQNE